MSLVTWTKEEFGTDVTVHDEEHQELFSLLNKLHDTVPGGDRAAIGSALDGLLSSVGKHFASEEANLIKVNFADFPAHKAAHETLLAAGADLQKKFHAGEA